MHVFYVFLDSIRSGVGFTTFITEMFLLDHRRFCFSPSCCCLCSLFLLDETFLSLNELLMFEEHMVGVLKVAEEYFIAVFEVTEELLFVFVFMSFELALGGELISTLGADEAAILLRS